jgi:hypothetical protein
MEVSGIIKELDAQITKLEQARALLSGSEIAQAAKHRGRPKGSNTASKVVAKTAKKRVLSPEGRQRIADAVKKRWAARRKAAKTAGKA